MKVDVYKNSQGKEITYIDHGIAYVGNLIFDATIEVTGEIKRWSPFLSVEKNGDMFTFKCPVCGSENCERPDKLYSDPHFWQGHYICSYCGSGEYCYHGDCFTREKQNNLFNE